MQEGSVDVDVSIFYSRINEDHLTIDDNYVYPLDSSRVMKITHTDLSGKSAAFMSIIPPTACRLT